MSTPLVLRPVSRLRQKVRLRTRLRAWRSRRILIQATAPDGWAYEQGPRRLGAFPDGWRSRADLPIEEPARVAVVLHAFYPELLAELFERVRRIPVEFDLLITNATGRSIEVPADIGLLRAARVFDVENHGRDILPMIHLVNAGYLDPYQVVLKVHTKRSGWRAAHAGLEGDGESWRAELLDSVLGESRDIAAILSAFSEQSDLGFVTASGSVLGPDQWGGNEARVEALLRRIELVPDRARLRFAAGSVYWVRGFVLQGLRSFNLGPDDFEEEQGQVNATTAHALERALGIVAVEAGLSLVERSALPPPRDPESFRGLVGSEPTPRARIVPFYLPQFHPIPENDRWWGEGFTEWTNVTSARPLYPGHYQPRLPRYLGFYDLRLDQVRRDQLALASSSGLSGFMYYHYWFGGKPLLHTPIDALVASDITQPFCIMWANENWTRRWDGRESDLLIGQDYEHVPAEDFIDDVLPLLADERYMKIESRKILAVYRPGQIPNLREVLSEWRARARAAGAGELFLISVDMVANFDGIGSESAGQGFDGMLGFPPHNHRWQWLTGEGMNMHPDFRGNMLSYAAIAMDAERGLNSGVDATYYPGVMVAFDNTARRQWQPDIWYGSNPYTFRRWLSSAVDAVLDRPADHRLVFVNAWNEWAESAVLEPTNRFGRTYLLAVRDVVSG